MSLRDRVAFGLSAALVLAFPCTLDAQEHTTLGGYGEVHYINPTGANTPARVTLARFVVYLAHTFNERIAFRSELEVEDTRVEGGEPGGEVALDQAFLYSRLGEPATVRVGLLLLPIALPTEPPEPPTFNGVARPLYHEVVLPSTWRDIGIGVLGTVPGAQGLAYRAFVVNGLLAEGFDAEQGIRGGRQEGRNASCANPALTARLEYARPGLKIRAAVYHGGSAQDDPALGTGPFSSPVTIVAADGRYDVGGFAFRAEAANVSVPDAALIDDEFAKGVGKRIAGWYAEGAYNLLRLLAPASRQRLSGFARYERLDTQAGVPSNVTRDESLARRITTVGLTWKPVPNVAFKWDYQLRRTAAHAGQDEVLSLGAGYQF